MWGEEVVELHEICNAQWHHCLALPCPALLLTALLTTAHLLCPLCFSFCPSASLLRFFTLSASNGQRVIHLFSFPLSRFLVLSLSYCLFRRLLFSCLFSQLISNFLVPKYSFAWSNAYFSSCSLEVLCNHLAFAFPFLHSIPFPSPSICFLFRNRSASLRMCMCVWGCSQCSAIFVFRAPFPQTCSFSSFPLLFSIWFVVLSLSLFVSVRLIFGLFPHFVPTNSAVEKRFLRFGHFQSIRFLIQQLRDALFQPWIIVAAINGRIFVQFPLFFSEKLRFIHWFSFVFFVCKLIRCVMTNPSSYKKKNSIISSANHLSPSYDHECANFSARLV